MSHNRIRTLSPIQVQSARPCVGLFHCWLTLWSMKRWPNKINHIRNVQLCQGFPSMHSQYSSLVASSGVRCASLSPCVTSGIRCTPLFLRVISGIRCVSLPLGVIRGIRCVSLSLGGIRGIRCRSVSYLYFFRSSVVLDVYLYLLGSSVISGVSISMVTSSNLGVYLYLWGSSVVSDVYLLWPYGETKMHWSEEVWSIYLNCAYFRSSIAEQRIIQNELWLKSQHYVRFS